MSLDKETAFLEGDGESIPQYDSPFPQKRKDRGSMHEVKLWIKGELVYRTIYDSDGGVSIGFPATVELFALNIRPVSDEDSVQAQTEG